ncbi:MAG: hypothetical protein D6737_00590 [Chloroflexi bacterium]|nr:MAG: hypothetical protein CUN54_01835 [Phototrophicales bacterium]RMF82863.1 MAG: hypothetical protein D6737_00590 [Chloroflexota bacterium]
MHTVMSIKRGLAARSGLVVVWLFMMLPMMAVGMFAVQAQDDNPPLYVLPDARTNRAISSSSMVITPEGLLIAANMLNNTVSIVAPVQGVVVAEIPVGLDPRTIALTDDGERALVVNRGDATVSVIDIRAAVVENTFPVGGVLPYGIVSNSNIDAYITVQGSNEVVRLNIITGDILERIAVPPNPAGIAIWGNLLYVTHLWNGQLTLIYLPTGRVVESISTGGDVSLSQAIEIDTTRGLAYLPQSRSNNHEQNPTYDTTIFPIVNTVDLSTLQLIPRDRIALSAVDRPVNMPFAAAVDRNQRIIYVANAGSNDVSMIDLSSGRAIDNIPVGANPRAILLNRDNSVGFVHNMLDGTISIINTAERRVIDLIVISNLTIPADILIGSQLFHSATDARVSNDNLISCASCHFDGLSDGRVWPGVSDGVRNTPVLFNLLETAPYNWSGTWDELADVELKIRTLQAGTGLIEGQTPFDALAEPHAGLSPDLDTLTAYLATLQGPTASPPDDADLVARGAALFTQLECATCHVGVAGTDLQRHDVGTGGEFDTPGLRWLWLSAPYLHDGRAATLRELFILPGMHQLIVDHSPEELDALIAYLLSLPQAQ